MISVLLKTTNATTNTTTGSADGASGEVVKELKVEAIKGKDVIIQMEQENGIIWEINGLDVESAQPVGMEVLLGSDAIPSDAMTAASVVKPDTTVTKPEEAPKQETTTQQSTETQQTPTETIEIPEESGSNLPLILIIIAVLVVGAAAIVAVVIRKKKEEE